MIKIIKKSPENYIMTCDKCDCVFSYELSDVHLDYYCRPAVICPNCKKVNDHDNRKRQTTTSLREDN